MKIHKTGHKIIVTTLIISVFIAVIVYLFTGFTTLLLIITLPILCVDGLIIRFFRVPNRIAPSNNKTIYSSADGEIVTIEQTTEKEYLNKECIQVSVFMSIYNIHINWFPIEGIVKKFIYHPGKFYMARLPKSSELNERTTTAIESNGHEIVIRQIAGVVARRIVSKVPKKGTPVKQGQELGFIKFGSRVDLFLPLGSKILVKPGQKVKGKLSEIAILP